MTQWKESAKTVVLSLLVLASFWLTATLWSSQPQLQPIEPVRYVESKPVQEKMLEDLVTPESIVFHYGDDRHTRAVSTDGQYRTIVQEEMAKWIFLDFQSYTLTEEQWEQLTRKSPGLEIRFRSTIPMSIVSRMFAFRDDNYEQLAGIDRLWLYHDQAEDLVYALFISSENEQVMRARTAVTPKDLRESYLPVGKPMPEQIMNVVKKPLSTLQVIDRHRPFWHVFYLPKHSIKMRQFVYNYFLITSDEVIDTFFLDRSLVRQIMERDKTIIYTDGSRSLQYRPEQQAITFTDPAFSQGDRVPTTEEKVMGAVSFINKHLGWTDNYHFETIRKTYNDKDLITFRQYLGAYPLISSDGYPLDTITITSEAGQVATMSRSLIDLDKYISHRERVMMSGPELFQYIQDSQMVDTSRVRNAYLAYQTIVHQSYVELIPVWVVELLDDTKLYINARSQQGGGKESGLE